MAASWQFEAIGTHWQVDINEAVLKSELHDIKSEVQSRVESFDGVYSRFRSDSVVSRMARRKGRYRLPYDARQLIGMYQELYVLTRGLITPLIGQVLADAGYDESYSLQPKTLSKPPDWEEVLLFEPGSGQAHPYLTLLQPALLDFGAAGKGYLVDLTARILAEHGLRSYCVDASGDMLQGNSSEQALRVGLEHPEDPNKVIGVAHIINASLCGSAVNRRAWGEYHHIINPHNLKPVKGVRAVWVVAKTGLIADAIASSLFFVSAKRLQTRYDFEYVLLRDDYSYQKSDGFPGEMLV